MGIVSENTFIILLQIVIGVIGLGGGAEIIVRSSISLANIYKVSAAFISFTIIALGTSLPELAATIQALEQVNSVEIALGNIIGSNIANILLILGIVGYYHEIIFPKKDLNNKNMYSVIIFTIIAFIFYVLTNEGNSYTPIFALLLLVLLFAYLLLQYYWEKKAIGSVIDVYDYSHLKSYIYLIIGLVLLYYGSQHFIIGSNSIADKLGIKDTIIGLTLVALGTSLPELATGIVAARKQQTGIAVGTILGSNVYNIIGIFAIIVLISPDTFPKDNMPLIVNGVIMLLVTLLFFFKVRIGIPALGMQPHKIGKNTARLFLSLYALFILFNYFLNQ